MKIDFKILRVDILSKFFLKQYSHENFKFSMLISSYYTKFQIRKSIFLEILKVDNFFIKVITNDLKYSYLFQKIKWEKALGKPVAFIVKPILIWVTTPMVG